MTRHEPNTQGASLDDICREFGRLQREHNLPTWDFQRDFIREIASKERAEGERRGRKDEKERILACGHAREPVHGFQPYGLMDEEKERAIFEDGFSDGRAMLMIDVMSKRDPRKATLPADSTET